MKSLQIADLFCGAGGSTTGIRQAVARMGRKANILAINHWEVTRQIGNSVSVRLSREMAYASLTTEVA